MQAVKKDSTGRHLGLPKGGKTRRIIIPCSLAEELAEFAGNAWSDGRAFYARGGGLMDHNKFNTVAQEAAKRARVTPVHFHALRHTTASLLRSMGADLLSISRYLGHSDPSVTLNLYSHLFEHETQDLADRMEQGRQEYLVKIKELDV